MWPNTRPWSRTVSCPARKRPGREVIAPAEADPGDVGERIQAVVVSALAPHSSAAAGAFLRPGRTHGGPRRRRGSSPELTTARFARCPYSRDTGRIPYNLVS